MQNFDSMFGYMFSGIGVLCLYFAFRGKGMAYNNHYPKAIKAEADKLLRLFLWILGPIVLAQGILDITGITAQYPFIYAILFVVTFALLIAYYVIFRKKFGKTLNADQSREINRPL